MQVFHHLQRKPRRPDVPLLADLPSGMRYLAMSNLAMIAVRDLATYDAKAARGNPDWISTHSPSSEFKAWLNVGRLWGRPRNTGIIRIRDAPRKPFHPVNRNHQPIGIDDFSKVSTCGRSYSIPRSAATIPAAEGKVAA
jgi:hypothetical protein